MINFSWICFVFECLLFSYFRARRYFLKKEKCKKSNKYFHNTSVGIHHIYEKQIRCQRNIQNMALTKVITNFCGFTIQFWEWAHLSVTNPAQKNTLQNQGTSHLLKLSFHIICNISKYRVNHANIKSISKHTIQMRSVQIIQMCRFRKLLVAISPTSGLGSCNCNAANCICTVWTSARRVMYTVISHTKGC